MQVLPPKILGSFIGFCFVFYAVLGTKPRAYEARDLPLNCVSSSLENVVSYSHLKEEICEGNGNYLLCAVLCVHADLHSVLLLWTWPMLYLINSVLLS